MGGFGDLTGVFLSISALDYSNSNSLLHVSDSESSKRSVHVEGFNDNGLGWLNINDGGITAHDKFRLFFNGFISSFIKFAFDFFEFAGNVRGVAI